MQNNMHNMLNNMLNNMQNMQNMSKNMLQYAKQYAKSAFFWSDSPIRLVWAEASMRSQQKAKLCPSAGSRSCTELQLIHGTPK
jgi:hypothetical protein